MPEIIVTKENGGVLTHRPEAYFTTFPFGLFGAKPFGLMKRFTEEMDRTFANLATANFTTPEFELWGATPRSQTQGWRLRRHRRASWNSKGGSEGGGD